MAAISGTVAVYGCSGSAATAPDAVNPGTTPTTTDRSDGSAGDGSAVDDPGSADAATDAANEAAAPGTPCTGNGDCRGGTCFEGYCFCEGSVFIQPQDGKCGPTPPGPACSDQGGKCLSPATMCPTGKTRGSASATKRCGDFVAAVCCFTCLGPDDFTCCTPLDGGVSTAETPICVNGWKACPDGDTPKHGASDGGDGVCGL